MRWVWFGLVVLAPVWGVAQQPVGSFLEFQLADSAGRVLATPADTAGADGLHFYLLGSTDTLVSTLPLIQPIRYNKRGKTWRLPATVPRRPLIVGVEWHRQRMAIVVPAQPGGHWVGRLPFWSAGVFTFARYDFWDTGYGTRNNLLDWLAGSLHRKWHPAPNPEAENFLTPQDQERIQAFLSGANAVGNGTPFLRW